ncbi:MAG: toxin-antitoxin system YwqK family antitoxin [Bacteroidia bacterium]
MRFLFFCCLLALLVSCSGKPSPIRSGQIVDTDGRPVVWTQYVINDSFIEEGMYNGKMRWWKYAKTQKEFDDSTFYQVDFFENGVVRMNKHFKNGIPDKIWRQYFETGKTKSITHIESGKALDYKAYNEEGNLVVRAAYTREKIMERSEFYPDGKPFQQMSTDSTGAGRCTTYHANGKPSAEGNLMRYAPGGIWNRWDSLGNALPDTLYKLEL